MSAAQHVIGRVIGTPIPATAGRPLASIGVNFAALSVYMTFFGPWFVGDVHASTRQASLSYVAAGLAGMGAGYLGGRLTDRFGPRLMVRTGSLAQILFAALILLPGAGVRTGTLSLIGVTFFQPVRGVAQRIGLARTGPAAEVEQRFTGYRLVINVGSFAGPLLAAGLVAVGWWAVHLEVTVLLAGSLLLATRLPHRAAPDPAAGTARARIWRDPQIYGLMIATTAAWTVVYTYESVLPIVLTQSYGYSPSTWGLVYALGPVLIVLLQFRLMAWFGGHSLIGRLAAGTLLMSAGFPLLILDHSLPVLLLVVGLFLVGDMIWGPAGEYAPLRIAPASQQATYVGVLTSSIWLGSALAPGIGLPVADRFGVPALWVLVLLTGVLAAAVYRLTTAAATTEPEEMISS